MGASYFLKCVSFPCFPCLLLRAHFWKERKQRGSEPILYYLYYNKMASPDNSRLYSEQASFRHSRAGGDIKEFTIVLHSLFKNLTMICTKWNAVAHWSEFTYYLQVSKSYLANFIKDLQIQNSDSFIHQSNLFILAMVAVGPSREYPGNTDCEVAILDETPLPGRDECIHTHSHAHCSPPLVMFFFFLWGNPPGPKKSVHRSSALNQGLWWSDNAINCITVSVKTLIALWINFK